MSALDVALVEPPAPPKRHGGRPLKYAWDSLEVGDSLLVATLANRKHAYRWARRHGRRFSVRKSKTRPYGYRVERIA